jgi:hypothetical protein
MKIVFIINRQNTYNFFSTLINEGIVRGHEIELWHDYSCAYKKPFINKSPFYKESIEITYKKITKEEGIVDLIKKSKYVDYFVSLNPVTFSIDNDFLKKIDGKWCVIQHGHDSFSTVWGWQAFKFDARLLQEYRRIFFSYADFFYDDRVRWLKKYSKLYGDGDNYTFFTSTNTETFHIGCTIYDNNMLNIEKTEIYKKYGFPMEKGVFLYFPFMFQPSRATYSENGNFSWQVAFTGKYRDLRSALKLFKSLKVKEALIEIAKKIFFFSRVVVDKEAFYWLINGWSEAAVLRSIKKFCQNNDMILIVKPKSESNISYSVSKYADFVIEDNGEFYPSLLQKLIAISDITLGYHTTAVTEAVIGRAHHINLECPDANLSHNKARLKNHHTKENGRNNFYGIVTNYKIRQFIDEFPNMGVDKFSVNNDSRLSYMRSYTGKDCIYSAYSFYNILENKINHD